MTEPNRGPLDFRQELESLQASISSWPSELGSAFKDALQGDGTSGLVAVLVLIVVGLVGERLICWKLNSLNQIIRRQHVDEWKAVFGYALFRLMFELVAVLVFGVFAMLALYFTVDNATPLYETLKSLIYTIVVFRGVMVLARALLSPNAEGIRPVNLDDSDARTFFRWTQLIVSVYVLLELVGNVIRASDMDEVLVRGTFIACGTALVVVVIACVWTERTRFERVLTEAHTPTSTLKQILSQSWPFIVTAWFIILLGNWAYSIFVHDEPRLASTQLSWWITLMFPIVDRLVNAALHKLTRLEFLADTGFEKRRDRFVSIVQTCIRVILAAVAVMAMAVTWHVADSAMLSSGMGQQVIWRAVDIGVIVLIAYVLYEIVMSLLDKHMAEPQTEQADNDGEIGGAGATREETLAPLLRSGFIVLLVIVLILSVLNSLGVQILPLLAGASIIGLALGFGAQKLVQDIISGIFFLIDDAFRRGEYIDIGSVKGTVEKVSIRSMQLRHHLGALHTVPFGEIHHLTNFSRDWVMMKLKLRLTYDTDIEKVRKLIKKLGQEMLEEPEIGEKFMQPLKSQGVYSMEDDSAMIVRLKFMTKPGDQFEVRKAVYARVRELFEHENIRFANRVVSVHLDGDRADELTDTQKRQVAAAALRPATPPSSES